MQRVTSETRSPIGRATTQRLAAGSVSFVAAGAAVMSLVALHALSPELDPTWRMISEYALGDFGGLLALMFVGLAVSSFALAAGLCADIATRGGRIGAGLLVASGIGLAMAAMFDVRHSLHGLAALVGIPSMALAPLVLSVSFGHRRALLWIAHLVWISLVVLVVTMVVGLVRSGGEMGPDILVGVPNRVMVGAYAAWLMLASRGFLDGK